MQLIMINYAVIHKYACRDQSENTSMSRFVSTDATGKILSCYLFPVKSRFFSARKLKKLHLPGENLMIRGDWLPHRSRRMRLAFSRFNLFTDTLLGTGPIGDGGVGGLDRGSSSPSGLIGGWAAASDDLGWRSSSPSVLLEGWAAAGGSLTSPSSSK